MDAEPADDDPHAITTLPTGQPVGPLGRAIAAAGGDVRTVDPGGLGVVVLSPSGALRPTPLEPPARPDEVDRTAIWWWVAIAVAAVAAVLAWMPPSPHGDATSAGADRPAAEPRPSSVPDPAAVRRVHHRTRIKRRHPRRTHRTHARQSPPVATGAPQPPAPHIPPPSHFRPAPVHRTPTSQGVDLVPIT